jgi:hypothetical protein
VLAPLVLPAWAERRLANEGPPLSRSGSAAVGHQETKMGRAGIGPATLGLKVDARLLSWLAHAG